MKKVMQSGSLRLRLAISAGCATLACLKILGGHSPDYAISELAYWFAVSVECVLAVSCWLLPIEVLGAIVIGLAGSALLVGLLLDGPCGCLGGAFERERAATMAVAGLAGLLGLASLSHGDARRPSRNSPPL